MTRIIIAGDSWGTNSYEKNFLYPELEGYKIAPKKTYVLYPGPGYFLQQLSNLQVLTIADHGVSNQEALEQLRKTPHKDDIIIFYQTGVLRDLSRAYMNKKIFHTTKDCKLDYEYYANKFYDDCSKLQCKHFFLIGGCAKVDEDKAKDLNVIIHSITEWLNPEFTDSEFDNTHYWLESVEPTLYDSDDWFKQGVIKSADKIDFWNERPEYYKNHPTVDTNKKIAKKIYDYLKDRTIL